MRITEVRTTAVGTPWRDLVFVELETDDGSGRCRRGPAAQQDRIVRGRRRRAGRPLRHRRRPVRHGTARLGDRAPASTAARASTASRRWPRSTSPRWDLMGQTSACLSGSSSVAGSASASRPTPTAGTRPTASRRDRRAGAATVVARGYRAMKLDPFGGGERAGCPRPSCRRALGVVGAVRDAVGPDIDLMIEMHGRFSPGRRRPRSRPRLEPYAPALDRGAGPARERGRPGAGPRGHHMLDRDRRADPRDLGCHAVHRGRRGRHRPGRPDPFRWLPGMRRWPAGPRRTT